ncbi:STY1053 family phage-associated protein [Frateuria aurantia]|uniref:Uncharacterized protein n=1 Tax=Frateuria aurantia (strain ATCC 33424 / DSM 6220 / KCTC 2777 / LMG 1558 / NBRC 3245 / NCIMB 13370) TaxID=767434 RepID=H8L669_FRAAD|nr:hypothetical protein [Frateuria aurantia]AFC85913.1 hypothetical protein Fraau_1492 [Frateuria aurantia DSM 6220]
MPRINVTKAFTFTHATGERQRFPVGCHEVAESVAGHWYAHEHSEPVADADVIETDTPAKRPRRTRKADGSDTDA